MTGVLVSRLSARAVVAATVAAAVATAGLPAAAAEGGRARPAIARADRLSARASGNAAADADALAARARGRARIAVAFTPGPNAEAGLAEARAAGGEVARRIPQLGVVVLDLPLAAAPRVAAALARRSDVTSVSPVRGRRLAAAPNDPEFSGAQGYLTEVNAPAAWDVTKGNADSVIAIVDSGIDTTHPDLAGKVVASHKVDPEAPAGDAIGHGTFVAGVAAAATNNEVGIAGAGYDAKLLSVKVADAAGVVTGDALAAGIVWAADNGADVINLSVRGTASDATEQSAVAYAVGKGVVVVAAAGNDATTTPTYPAAYPNVVAVGATNGAARATSSNHGSWVDVGAPGVGIKGTTPAAGSALFAAGEYAVADGTSFAAALVAGQAALLRSVNPANTAADIVAAITQSATTASYGFAAGRVDFHGAFDRLRPTSVPSFVTPLDGATVSGTVNVTATSGAPRVRFTLPSGATVSADVVEGVASAPFPTHGRSGAQAVQAQDCTLSTCSGVPVSRAFSVTNPAPALTGPSNGATVNTASFTARATTADGLGAVSFLVDGVPVAADHGAPFEAEINTSALSEGSHQLTAVLCSSDGVVCDSANPSAPVAFTVASLHPSVVSLTPGTISPNGDGAYDTTTLTYALDTAQDVSILIRDAGGALVRGPVNLGRLSGTRTWVWNGRVTGGSMATDGTYTIEVATTKQTPDGTLSGSASRTVRVDRTAPSLWSVSGSGTTFYPYKDGYKDTFATAVSMSERSRLVLNVYNSAGSRVRSLDLGTRSAGRHTATWTGRRADGSMVPAGTYRYEFVATDLVRNVRKTARYTVYLSAKKLVGKVATKALAPASTMTDSYVGDCSEGSTPAAGSGWAGSIGYYSDYYGCSVYALDDFVMSQHAFTLPSAIKYGSIRIAGLGKEAVAGYGDTAHLGYLDSTGATTDWYARLGASYGTYWGHSVPARNLLNGRRLAWFVGVSDGAFYHLRTLYVRWTYYVLA